MNDARFNGYGRECRNVETCGRGDYKSELSCHEGHDFIPFPNFWIEKSCWGYSLIKQLGCILFVP
jgi:hypothetical protein